MEIGILPRTGTLNGLRSPGTQHFYQRMPHVVVVTEHSMRNHLLVTMWLGGYTPTPRTAMITIGKEILVIRFGSGSPVPPELPVRLQRPQLQYRPRRRHHQLPPPRLHPRPPLPPLLLSHRLPARNTCTWGTQLLGFTQSVRRLALVYLIGVFTATWRRTEEGGCCSTPTIVI